MFTTFERCLDMSPEELQEYKKRQLERKKKFREIAKRNSERIQTQKKPK